ncbi:hypothetical protein FG386_000394 [Cryptosporidium ryanae]|uniref:uncharacterized protein n=1 Tax=Cryptosporidium ryanae TaxID=515981 RepID=UPI00351A3BFB|nr:hypothetical protein FG386_000394 [Cryptosporidium ryanae]
MKNTMNINFYMILLIIIKISHFKRIDGYITPSSSQLFDTLVSISSGLSPFRFEPANITEVKYIRHAEGKNETKIELDGDIRNITLVGTSTTSRSNTTYLETGSEEVSKFSGLRGVKTKEEFDVDLSKNIHSASRSIAAENFCVQHNRTTSYFNPFAETARGVGIPATSSHKITIESNKPHNLVLDSKTLLESYYFNYDKYPLKMTSTILKSGNKEWISKSLLSLIYKSEGDDSLSFLILSYGVINSNWQMYSFKESHVPELVEEYEDLSRENLGDIALNSTRNHIGT